VVSADTDLVVGKRHVSYGGVHGKALTIKQFPEEVSIVDVSNFIGNISRNELQITCPFFLTLNLFVHGDKLKDVHKQKSEFLYKQKAASSLSVMLTKKQEESKWAIEKLVDGHRMLKGYLVWWLYHDDLERVNKNAQVLRSLLSMKEYKLQEEIRTVNMGLMLSASPMNASYEMEERLLKRSVTMFDFNAANLSPCQADWKGTGTPLIPFLSARGQAQFIDFFDGSEGYNAIVAARTGSGKSFLIEHVLFSYYTLHDVSNIWVIDIGESYKLPCTLVGGSYIDMSDDSDLVLNPFSDCDNLQGDIELLVRLYAKMAKPTETANDTEKAVIEEAIKAAFDGHGRATIVDDVIDELNAIAGAAGVEAPKKHAASVIATNLYRWGSQGSYGRFFNGRNSIDLSHKLVVLELKNLANREDLRNVVLMVLFYHMYRVIYVDDDRSKRKIIVFDEAHQFLGDPQVSRFVERLYRTLRKHAGSAITITQGLNDFYANEGTREILFQAAYWILLPQKQESLELLRSESKLSLSDYEFEQLTRLRTVKGQYSELFFFTPYGRGVGRLLVPKELYWVYTTDPAEVSKRADLINQYGLDAGIRKCAELYGG
jgi:conjugal transfer ATP-binding protein TraC